MIECWQYSTIHDFVCKVIETRTLWDDSTCRVWLPGSDPVVRISAVNLKPLEDVIIAMVCEIPEKILQEDPKLLMWYDQAVTRTGEES